jgi:hypothetical protein
MSDIAMTDAQKCFKMAVDFSGNQHKILVDKVLSTVNHRLYRQGMTYQATVKVDPNFQGQVHLFTLSHTWKTRAAYRLAKRKWLEATKDERKTLGNRLAKWYDFRVGDGLTGWGEMKPIVWDASLSPTLYNPYFGGNAEYGYTDVADEAGSQWGFVVGETDHAGNTFGLLEEFDDSTNPDLEVAATGPAALDQPFQELQVSEQESTFDDFIYGGDIPPYHKYDALGSGVWQYVGSVGVDPTTGAARLSSGLLDIPLGMLATVGATMVGDPATNPVGELCLHIKPGSYKGVSAEPFAPLGGF